MQYRTLGRTGLVVSELGVGCAPFGMSDYLSTWDATTEAAQRTITDLVHVPVIASGGAGTPAHMTEAVTAGNADAVLAASIFHRDIHSVDAVKADMAAAGVPVRLTGGNA